MVFKKRKIPACGLYMTYYADCPDIDLKLYKIGTLHVMILFLAIQEEFRSFVMLHHLVAITLPLLILAY